MKNIIYITIALLVIGCSGRQSSQPQPPIKPSPPSTQPAWGYRIYKKDCPNLMVAAFPYKPNVEGHGKRICNDDLGSCLGAHSAICGKTGTHCEVVGLGWAAYYNATCSLDCEQMPNTPLYEAGMYHVEVDATTQCLSLIKDANTKACIAKVPGPSPRISRCLSLGNIPNYEGLYY